jgi:hypothetical protein
VLRNLLHFGRACLPLHRILMSIAMDLFLRRIVIMLQLPIARKLQEGQYRWC